MSEKSVSSRCSAAARHLGKTSVTKKALRTQGGRSEHAEDRGDGREQREEKASQEEAPAEEAGAFGEAIGGDADADAEGDGKEDAAEAHAVARERDAEGVGVQAEATEEEESRTEEDGARLRSTSLPSPLSPPSPRLVWTVDRRDVLETSKEEEDPGQTEWGAEARAAPLEADASSPDAGFQRGSCCTARAGDAARSDKKVENAKRAEADREDRHAKERRKPGEERHRREIAEERTPQTVEEAREGGE